MSQLVSVLLSISRVNLVRASISVPVSITSQVTYISALTYMCAQQAKDESLLCLVKQVWHLSFSVS